MSYRKPFKCPTCGREMIERKRAWPMADDPPLCPVCDVLEKPDETPDNGNMNDGSP